MYHQHLYGLDMTDGGFGMQCPNPCLLLIEINKGWFAATGSNGCVDDRIYAALIGLYITKFETICLILSRLDSNENTQMKQFRRNTRSRLDSKNTGSTFDGWNLPHLEYNKKYCNYRETTYQHRLVWRVGLSTHSFPLRLLFVFIYKMLHNSSFYLQTMYIYMYILPCHWIQSIYIYPFPTCL